MAKKTVTQYFAPLSKEERNEIHDLLIPIYLAKQKTKMADELQFAILKDLRTYLHQAQNSALLNSEERLAELNKNITQAANAWYESYVQQLGPSIRPEDIFAQISTDGLFQLKLSDTIKQIITTHDFELANTVTVVLPQDDEDLIRQANYALEEEADKA